MLKFALALTTLLLVTFSASFAQNPANAEYNVRDYGAIGDGTTLDTAAIQSAINAASAAGGGAVVFPTGTYLSSSIRMLNHVTLDVRANATLLGSPQWTGYQKTNFYAFLVAEGQTNIGIRGSGTINGNGVLLAADTQRLANEGVIPNAEEGYRPLIISFRNCTGITVRDITLRDSAMWVQDYRQCVDVLIENIKVRSNVVRNNDGLDLTDCKRVVVRGCDIDSEDDGICPKSSNSAWGCEDMLIENCRVRSSCNAVKFGTASDGGFKNVIVRNIEIYETYTSGLALEIVDGGTMENINISDIRMTGVSNPLFIRLGDRNTAAPPGILRGVNISNVTAEIPNRPSNGQSAYLDYYNHYKQELLTGMIAGIPGALIQDVKLSHITFVYGGIGSTPGSGHVLLENLTQVPEQTASYPDANRFGVVPAWGMYIRHAKNIQLENFTLQVKAGGTDYRAAVVCDDVQNLSLNGLKVLSAGTEAIVAMHNLQGATVRNSVPPSGAVEFVRQMTNTSGVSVVLPTTSWTGANVSNITTSSAVISDTLVGEAAEVTFYWKQGSSAPWQITGWDGSISNPGSLVSAGPVSQTITSLLPNTLYSGIFYATNASSEMWSAPVTFATAFSAAQVPVFNDPIVGQKSITLNWQDHAGTETGYILQRSASGDGPYVTIATLAANATSYVDNAIPVSASYFYRLAAVNSNNGSTTDFAAAQTRATILLAVSRTLTFTTPLTTHINWVCPPNVSFVTVECWAGGGAGGSVTSVAGGSTQARSGGGAGGSYSRVAKLAVTPNTTYKVIVGAGGSPVSSVTTHNTALIAQTGGESKFTNEAGTSEFVKATGGAGGRNAIKTSDSTVNVIGGSGSTDGNIGDPTFPGGNGGKAGATSAGGTGAGGGGGGAGSAAPGGSPTYAITGGAGGAIGGGSGGTARGAPGPIQSIAGASGGGGGGVVVSTSGQTNIGGAGAAGKVVLTYDDGPDHYALSAGSSQTAGQPFEVSIVAQDASGVTMNDTLNTVTLTSPGGSLLEFDWNGDGIYSDNSGILVNGVKTLKARNKKAETVTIVATAGVIAATGTTIITTVAGSLDPFSVWAGPSVMFDADSNQDGVDNGLAWFLGAGGPGENSAAQLPKPTRNSGALVLEFDCLNAADRGATVFEVQYGQLNAWAGTTIPGAPGTYTAGVVDFVVTDPGEPGGLLKVVATIPASEANSGRIFSRIRGVK